jgi:hypothetical protein
LGDWLLRRALRAVDMATALGWDVTRAQRLISGERSYTRADLEAVCSWLEVWPHELLMPPDLAMGLRQLRMAAQMVVASAPNL